MTDHTISRRALATVPAVLAFAYDALGGAVAEHSHDAGLLVACQRYAAARQAIRDADDLPDEDPRWDAYDAARDAISDARPLTIAGVLAKARAAMLDATDAEGFETADSGGAMFDEWAGDIVRDLLRLAGDKLPPVRA